MAEEDYLNRQLAPIKGTLQALFDEIGLSHSEREKRQQGLLEAISQALQHQVQLVTDERDEVKNNCNYLKDTIKLMLDALKDVDVHNILGRNTQVVLNQPVTGPLLTLKQSLEAARNCVEAIYSDRLAKFNKYSQELNSFQQRIDSIQLSDGLSTRSQPYELNTSIQDMKSGVIPPIDLSRNRINDLELEVGRWENEYKAILDQVRTLSGSIVNLWADLGTPAKDMDQDIVSHYKSRPEQLGTLSSDISRLQQNLEILKKQKIDRENKYLDLRDQCQGLWEKLQEDPVYIETFCRDHRGLNDNVLSAYQAELHRLLEKKKQHIHIFIEHARNDLQSLWTQLYFVEEETYLFSPAWNETYTDASLDAHEAEIARLKEMLDQRRPVLALVDQYGELQKEERELEESTHDASRLLSRGGGAGRLLREEKMRKRIARTKPRILQELRISLENWLEQTGSQFLVNGVDFLEHVTAEQEKLALKATPGRRGITSTASYTASATRTNTRTISNSSSSSNNTVNSVSSVRRLPFRTQPANWTASPTRPVRNRQPVYTSQPLTSGNLSNRLPARTAHSTINKVMKNPPSMHPAKPIASIFSSPESPVAAIKPTLSNSPIKTTVNNSPFKTMVNNSPYKMGTSPARSMRTVSNKENSGSANSPAKVTMSYSKGSSPIRQVEYSVGKASRSPSKPALSLGNRPALSPPKMASPTRTSGAAVTATRAAPVTTSSSNWQIYEDEQSSDGEFNDPSYLQWRQQAMSSLARSPGCDVGASPAGRRGPRESEFDWNKHTF